MFGVSSFLGSGQADDVHLDSARHARVGVQRGAEDGRRGGHASVHEGRVDVEQDFQAFEAVHGQGDEGRLEDRF